MRNVSKKLTLDNELLKDFINYHNYELEDIIENGFDPYFYEECLKSETLDYEVLYYFGKEEDPTTIYFSTKQEAMDYYEEYKNDTNKRDWWVRKIDKDYNTIEEYIS